MSLEMIWRVLSLKRRVKLGASSRLLLVVIANEMSPLNGEWNCQLSMNDLAEMVGVSAEQVRILLHNLVQRGMLEKEEQMGKPNIYRLVLPDESSGIQTTDRRG